MLMRTDPFGQWERMTEQLLGPASKDAYMPLDAYRSGDSFVVHFDVPGVDPESIELSVEHNALTVTAQRKPLEAEPSAVLVTERPTGTFSRQVVLSESLDVERVDAHYEAGVLTVSIPVAEQAKPRKIPVVGSRRHELAG